MNPLVAVLRLIHILVGVYWAGTIFFFVTFLEPSLRSLGPDGGKVMVRFFERGYLKLLPSVALVTILSGLWMLWIVSGEFDPAWMGSRVALPSAPADDRDHRVHSGMVIMRPAGGASGPSPRDSPGTHDEAERTP
jgi:hypothetical protein